MKILSFGEIIWDIYPDKKCIGGAPLNFAAHARKAGAEAYLLSAVGDDELGRDALLFAEKCGMSTELISVLENGITGQCTVTLSDGGIPSYDIVENVAYDRIPFCEGLAGERFDALNFGSLALRGEHNRQAIDSLLSSVTFGEIFVDINLRAPFYSRENILFCLDRATVLKVSDEELPALMSEMGYPVCHARQCIEHLAERHKNLKLIILTCGGDGARAFDVSSRRFYSCEAKKVKVISTVGAGDSFGAAFLVNYLRGCDIDACLKKASEISGIVVSCAEAIPNY